MTEEELFIELEALEAAERAVKAQRRELEDKCYAFGKKIGYGGRFRIDHLRINYNMHKVKKEQAA